MRRPHNPSRKQGYVKRVHAVHETSVGEKELGSYFAGRRNGPVGNRWTVAPFSPHGAFIYRPKLRRFPDAFLLGRLGFKSTHVEPRKPLSSSERAGQVALPAP